MLLERWLPTFPGMLACQRSIFIFIILSFSSSFLLHFSSINTSLNFSIFTQLSTTTFSFSKILQYQISLLLFSFVQNTSLVPGSSLHQQHSSFQLFNTPCSTACRPHASKKKKNLLLIPPISLLLISTFLSFGFFGSRIFFLLSFFYTLY